MMERRCFWAKVLAISWGQRDTLFQTTGQMREDALIYSKVVPSSYFTQIYLHYMGILLLKCSNNLKLHFHHWFEPFALHVLYNMTSSICQHSLSAAAASYGSILICMVYAVAFHDTERDRKKKDRRGEDKMRCCGMCLLTVRCCSSGLVYSSYRLKGGRRDVGVTVMGTKSAHTWTMRYRDTSQTQHARNNNVNNMSNKNVK